MQKHNVYLVTGILIGFIIASGVMSSRTHTKQIDPCMAHGEFEQSKVLINNRPPSVTYMCVAIKDGQ